MEKDLDIFIKSLENKIIPLSIQANKAGYEASISGKEEDYKRYADLEYENEKRYTEKNEFAFLKKVKESGAIKDSILRRELNVFYCLYAGNQIDSEQLKKLIDAQSVIERKFSTFRIEINHLKISDNELDSILKNSKSSEEVKHAWLSSKNIGKEVSKDVLDLVKLRNKTARQLGYKNFHQMKLELDDQEPSEIEKLFNELDVLTKDAYSKKKIQVDDFLAKKFNINKEDLMPWHYQDRFFQESPQIYRIKLDEFYKNIDILEVTRKFYAGIGLPIDDIIERSDLYEKPGKNQHAFSTDIDRNGDVRVLVNIRSDSYWMNTLLHEFGHSVYDKNNDRSLPFTLRTPAHTFTTEAIALMFGRFASNPTWIKENVKASETDINKSVLDISDNLELEQLVFSRWSQVMFRFEKSMYENPDQDLNSLWWKLVEKYQLLKKPMGRDEPDWASKIHIATVPCYYHNYLMGDLLASQLYYYIGEKILKSVHPENESFTGHKEVGNYLVRNIFKPGNKWFWDTMIEKATGEKLTAKYYARQFVK